MGRLDHHRGTGQEALCVRQVQTDRHKALKGRLIAGRDLGEHRRVAGPQVRWKSTRVPSLSNRIARIGIAEGCSGKCDAVRRLWAGPAARTGYTRIPRRAGRPQCGGSKSATSESGHQPHRFARFLPQGGIMAKALVAAIALLLATIAEAAAQAIPFPRPRPGGPELQFPAIPLPRPGLRPTLRNRPPLRSRPKRCPQPACCGSPRHSPWRHRS